MATVYRVTYITWLAFNCVGGFVCARIWGVYYVFMTQVPSPQLQLISQFYVHLLQFTTRTTKQ